MRARTKSGFSLMELVVGIVVGMIGVIGIIQGWRFANQSRGKFEETLAVQNDAIEAVDFIRKLSRSARSCSKVTIGTSQGLQCDVDFGKIATLLIQRVRFVLVGSELQYQKNTASDGSFSTFTVERRYSNVNEFLVCDDADMALGAGGSCPLLPLELSRQHAIDLWARPNRYFRFSLKFVNPSTPGKFVVLQSSAYIRNPVAPGVYFQW